MRGPCQHFSDAERAISGTWVLDELRLALRKGYKMLEIHEVYEYVVTQYNTASGVGGLSKGIILNKNLSAKMPPSEDLLNFV